MHYGIIVMVPKEMRVSVGLETHVTYCPTAEISSLRPIQRRPLLPKILKT